MPRRPRMRRGCPVPNLPWFRSWLIRHIQRVPRPDWPDPDSAYWETWERSLADERIAEEEADEASRVVARNPPPYLAEQLQGYLATAKIVQTRMRLIGADLPVERAECEAESRRIGCECLGMGFVSRRTRWRTSMGNDVFSWVALYCVCVTGRWVRRAHVNARDGQPLTADLADHPALWSREEDTEESEVVRINT